MCRAVGDAAVHQTPDAAAAVRTQRDDVSLLIERELGNCSGGVHRHQHVYAHLDTSGAQPEGVPTQVVVRTPLGL